MSPQMRKRPGSVLDGDEDGANTQAHDDARKRTRLSTGKQPQSSSNVPARRAALRSHQVPRESIAGPSQPRWSGYDLGGSWPSESDSATPEPASGTGPFPPPVPVPAASTAPNSDVDLDSDSESDSDSGSSSGSESGSDVATSPPSDESTDKIPNASQYDNLRDNGFKHLRFEAQDDLNATQKLLSESRSQQLGVNRVADNGIIESITCINFMCHSKLHIKLGPLLNFIVGPNGSGKSAVLTALILCLGAKASSTSRGQNTKTLIKHGCDSCLLAVQIKNQGRDAYRPEAFGKSIIVERRIDKKQGGGGYKLKSEKGKIISTKRSDIDDIVEYYCLQVDNPINVLSQDMARQFLNASSPSQKYKFFVQGVQLEQLDIDYRIVADAIEGMVQKRDGFIPVVERREQAWQEARKLQESIKANEQLRQRSKLYRAQLCWTQVEAEERKLEQREAAVADADRAIIAAEADIATRTEELALADDNLRRTVESVAAVKDDESQAREKHANTEAEYQKRKAALMQMQAQERDAHMTLKAARETRDSLRDEKVKEEARLAEWREGNACSRKQAELREAQQREKETGEELDQLRTDASDQETRRQNMRDDLDQQNEVVRQKQREVDAVRSEVRALQKGHSGPLDGFDQNVRRLVDAINQNAHIFDVKPVGPIGSLLQLTEPIWLNVLEASLGRALAGFVVTSRSDNSRLAGLMSRHNVHNCDIFQVQPGSLDVKKTEPDKRFKTMLRVLNIAEESVRTALIMHFFIEQNILIEDDDEANHVMYDGHRAPFNVKACYSIHPTKPGYANRLLRKEGTNFETSPVDPPKGGKKPRIKSDSGEQLKIRIRTQEALEKELAKLRTETMEMTRKLQQAEVALKRANQAVDAHKKDRRLHGAHINQLQQELDSFEGVDDRLQALEEQLLEANEKFKLNGDQYGELAVKKREMNAAIEAFAKDMKDEAAQLKDIAARVRKAEVKRERMASSRQIIVSEKGAAHDALAAAQHDRATKVGQMKEQARTVQHFTAEARSIAETRVHVPAGETHASIEEKYKAITKQLNARQSRVGMTDEEINNRAAAAKFALDDSRKTLDVITEEIDCFKYSLAIRLKTWRVFQRLISSSARVNFMYLLSERGFRGRLLIDHRNKKLAVQIEPDEGEKQGDGRDTNTLSGGEKSFSMVCLLLATWESMGAPLRCLDEFDVFMDNVNRAVSTNILIATARRSVGKQYILITPNTIDNGIKLGKDVTIIRLSDPRQRHIDDM